jgi:hypothetical protein
LVPANAHAARTARSSTLSSEASSCTQKHQVGTRTSSEQQRALMHAPLCAGDAARAPQTPRPPVATEPSRPHLRCCRCRSCAQPEQKRQQKSGEGAAPRPLRWRSRARARPPRCKQSPSAESAARPAVLCCRRQSRGRQRPAGRCATLPAATAPRATRYARPPPPLAVLRGWHQEQVPRRLRDAVAEAALAPARRRRRRFCSRRRHRVPRRTERATAAVQPRPDERKSRSCNGVGTNQQE